MLHKPDPRSKPRRTMQTDSAASRVFGPMVEGGAAAYLRMRDLPKLLALWPHELADQSSDGRDLILKKLRRALRAERRRGLAGHWSYDLNRHLGLLSAYKGELAGAQNQPNCTRRGKAGADG